MKENIVNEPFEKLWAELWGSMDINSYSSEEINSKTKFENLKTGIQTKMGNFNLKDLVDDSSTNWETPEWGFPKGRRNYQEDDKKCALREFEEETNDDFENFYNGQVSKSGVAILPSKRTRRIPEVKKPSLADEALSELKAEQPEIKEENLDKEEPLELKEEASEEEIKQE